MQAVKNKNSKTEVKLCKELWKRDLRYLKNSSKIFGKPDVVFTGKKVAVFAAVNFGTSTTRNIKRKRLNLAESFEFLKSNATYNKILKLRKTDI